MGLISKAYWKGAKIVNRTFPLSYLQWCIENYKTLLKRNYYVLVGTPVHGNLGDQAIALAEYQFLHKCDENKDILEIPSHYVSKINAFRCWIGKRDILVHGGGFIGTLWIKEEKMLRNLVKLYPDNRIIVLPQTITYSNDAYGEKELYISQSIYNTHKTMIICTREQKSYEFALKYFDETKVIKIPDMVLQMRLNKNDSKHREGALLCLRADHEKKLTDKEQKEIFDICNNRFGGRVTYTDTNDAVYVPQNKRSEAVNRKLSEFKGAELVVTDRLHGMVFAALTGTPCVALGNINGKVKGIYEWIDRLGYIKYIDSVKALEKTIELVTKTTDRKYEYSYLDKEYMPLANILKAI